MASESSSSSDGQQHPADEPRNAAHRGLSTTIRDESTAFGFSIMITLTFGIVQREHGTPATADLLLFATGAVLGFTLLEALASRGFRQRVLQHGSEVMTLGTAMNFVSVGGAVAAAIGLSAAIGTDVAWPVVPLAAALTYLLAESAEFVLAERLQHARSDGEDASVMQE